MMNLTVTLRVNHGVTLGYTIRVVIRVTLRVRLRVKPGVTIMVNLRVRVGFKSGVNLGVKIMVNPGLNSGLSYRLNPRTPCLVLCRAPDRVLRGVPSGALRRMLCSALRRALCEVLSGVLCRVGCATAIRALPRVTDETASAETRSFASDMPCRVRTRVPLAFLVPAVERRTSAGTVSEVGVVSSSLGSVSARLASGLGLTGRSYPAMRLSHSG